MTEISVPHQDYLERIYEVFVEKGFVRVTDIAERLGVTPASVTNMLQKLETSGHLTREPYRGFTLTAEGKKVGANIQRRHKILEQFLRELNLPEKTIQHDIEGLEHHLSDTTLRELERVVKSGILRKR